MTSLNLGSGKTYLFFGFDFLIGNVKFLSLAHLLPLTKHTGLFSIWKFGNFLIWK
jgi:hypothetical protein